jgi:hypothetical protein
MQPFRGIFPPVEGAGESVLDVSVLFGILMYGLLALGVHSLIVWINRKVYSHDLHQAPTGYATRSYGEPPR